MIKFTIIVALLTLKSIHSQESMNIAELSSSQFEISSLTREVTAQPTVTQTTNTMVETTTMISSPSSSSSILSLQPSPQPASSSTIATIATMITTTLSTTTTTTNPSTTGQLEETNGVNSDEKDNKFISEIKYIYIIVGIILFLILIIIVLIAVVSIMCQRRMFDRKQKSRKNGTRKSQLLLTSVEVHGQPQSPLRPARSPKKTNPIDCGLKNGAAKTSDNTSSPMSDFPLLCRVLQDYDTAQQHKVTKISTSLSNDVFEYPVRENEMLANGTTNDTTSEIPSVTDNGAVGEVSFNKPKQLTINDELKSLMQNSEKFPLLPNKKTHPPVKPPPPNKKSVRMSSDSSSDRDLETSWGRSTIVSNVSGCRDSHDYDELESMIDHLKNKQNSPPRSPPKIPLKIPNTNQALPVPTNVPSVPSIPPVPQMATAMKNVLRNESMKRSQSADDIFDDPKYTRLSVGSSTSGTQPMPCRNSEIYDHLGDSLTCNIKVEGGNIKEGDSTRCPPKQPISKERSKSTSATGDIAIERRRDYKEYMSLQQLLDIMETKIPSRETSEETEDREEQLYCPRVLRPVQF